MMNIIYQVVLSLILCLKNGSNPSFYRCTVRFEIYLQLLVAVPSVTFAVLTREVRHLMAVFHQGRVRRSTARST